MNQVFIVKLLDGRIVNINCDALELKKKIQSYEQSVCSDCLMFYDQDEKAIISIHNLLSRQRNQISLIDAQRLVKELNIAKEKIQNMDKQIYVLKCQNSNILSIINKQNSRIQLLESNLEKKDQQNNKVVSSLQHQINELTEEHEQQLKIIKQNRSASEADLNYQIEELYGKILLIQENQRFKQKIKMTIEGKSNLMEISKQQTLKLINQISESKLQLELSQETKNQKGQENSQDDTNLNQKIYSTIDQLGQVINALTTQKTELENQISQQQQQMEQQNQVFSQQLYQAQQQMEQLNYNYQQRDQQIQQYMMEQQQQAAQNVATLTQEKETLIQKHKKEMEDHQRKFKQLKKDKDEQEEDYNNISRQLQQTKSQLQETLKKLNHATQTIKQLDDEKEELYKEKSNEQSATQMKEREIKKLKEDILSSNKTIEDLTNVNDTQRDQYSALLNQYKMVTSQFNEQINELNEQITELRATIGNQKVQIEALQKQISSLNQQQKISQEEQKNLLNQIANYKQQIQEVSTQGDGANKNLKDVQQQLKTKIKELEQMTILQDEAVKKQHSLRSQVNSLEGQIRQLKLQHDNLERNYNAVKQSEKELMEVNYRMMEDFTKAKEEDSQRFRADIEFRDIIIKKVCTNQQDKYIDKIIGPMEKIMNSEFKINRYQEDPNIKRDNTEYIIYEISFDKIKAQNFMKEQKWICFDECLQYQTLGSAKTIRSIQPNADVTLLKGYIIQIEEADNAGLKDKKLLRKEYKSQATPMLSTKEEAGKLSLNNLICKFLLERFNQMQGFPKIQGKQIQIQRQFILQVKGKEEYCYCEMIVEEQPFEKINGGAFQVKDTDIHQYLNVFSLFTYHIMNRQLIISNLQVVGQYLHDMIVSTQYKIFTPIDQGSSEIAQTLGILDKAPQAALSKYWNEKIQQQIKQGWK